MQRRVATSIWVLLWVMAQTPIAQAGEPDEIVVYPPQPLLSGEVYGPLAGTWYQRSMVRDGSLDAQVTFQLPAAPTQQVAGPILAIWQIVVQVADNAYGDTATRTIGPPVITAAIPNCDASGNCAVRFELSGPTRPAYEARKLEWAGATGLTFGVTLVRTFANGMQFQLVRPDLPVDGDGGTLAAPGDMYGALAFSGLIESGQAQPAELSGEEFHQGSASPYDWGEAVRRALPQVKSEPPEPLPINVWTPERPDSLHVSLHIYFTDSCPENRAIVFRSASGAGAPVVVPVSGATNVGEEIALALATDWSVGIETGDGTVLNRTDLQPLGSGTGLRISGPIACEDGKGVFTQEGIPQDIPNPNTATAGASMGASRPPATENGQDTPVSAAILPLVLVLAVAAMLIAFVRPWSRNNR